MSGNTIGKSASHLMIAKILTTLIALVSSMLLSRFRTVEEYGTFSELLITISLTTSLFTLGLPNSSSYFLPLAETADDRRRFLSVYFTFTTLLCAAIGLLLVACVPLVEAYFKNEAIRSFAFFLAIFPWASIMADGIGNILVAYGKTVKLMGVNIAATMVSLLSVVLIRVFHLSFRDYILAFLFGNVLIALWTYLIAAGLDGGLRFSLDGKLIRRILAYSVPIGLASLVGTLTIEIDKLMIGNMVDTEGLAYYTNAGKELPLTLVSTALTAVLLPQMARKLKEENTTEALSLWGEAIRMGYLIVCFFAAACVAFAPQVMTFLYSEKYLPGVQVFRVYSLILLLRCTYFGMVLSASGNSRKILWSSILALVLNVVLNWLLFLLLGFIGPAIASFVSICTVDLVQLCFTSRILKTPLKELFPWRALGRITLINAAWGFAAFVL